MGKVNKQVESFNCWNAITAVRFKTSWFISRYRLQQYQNLQTGRNWLVIIITCTRRASHKQRVLSKHAHPFTCSHTHTCVRAYLIQKLRTWAQVQMRCSPGTTKELAPVSFTCWGRICSNGACEACLANGICFQGKKTEIICINIMSHWQSQQWENPRLHAHLMHWFFRYRTVSTTSCLWISGRNHLFPPKYNIHQS